MMIEVEYYCDEAGRLGYVDQPERKRGEFTLVAGLIVESNTRPTVIEFCDYLFERYGTNGDGAKFHITDLGSNKENLRSEVFGFIKSSGISIAYGANYFQALYAEYRNQKQINSGAVEQMKAQGVGLSKNISMFKKNAQAEAFFSFYCKVMGFSIQHFNSPVCGLVKTDHIDNVLFENYEKNIHRYHTLNSNNPLKGSHYDYETGEIKHFGVSVDVKVEDPRYKLLSESSGQVEIVNSSVSILADVLANSLNHHLERYVVDSNCGPLNSFVAIQGFELAENFIALETKSMDQRYPYPVA